MSLDEVVVGLEEVGEESRSHCFLVERLRDRAGDGRRSRMRVQWCNGRGKRRGRARVEGSRRLRVGSVVGNRDLAEGCLGSRSDRNRCGRCCYHCQSQNLRKHGASVMKKCDKMGKENILGGSGIPIGVELAWWASISEVR